MIQRFDVGTRMSEMAVGNHRPRPLTGWAQFGGGVGRVDATKVRTVRSADVRGPGRYDPGYARVSATYDTGNGVMDVGLRITGADGREAVRLALQLRPDVGLFDIRMPLPGRGYTRCTKT